MGIASAADRRNTPLLKNDSRIEMLLARRERDTHGERKEHPAAAVVPTAATETLFEDDDMQLNV